MRRRAFYYSAGLAFVVFSAQNVDASAILVTQAAAHGQDSSGRLTGHVAAFQNNDASLLVWSLDDSIPAVTAALGGARGADFNFGQSVAQVAREWRGPGSGGSDELKADETDDLEAQSVSDDVLTSLLESGQGNEEGLTQALSAHDNGNSNGNGPSNGNGTGGNTNGNGQNDDGEDDDPVVVVTQVPEPGSLMLFGLALGGLCTFGRRRTR